MLPQVTTYVKRKKTQINNYYIDYKMVSKIHRLKNNMLNKDGFTQDTISKIEQLKYTMDIHNMLHERDLTHLRSLTFRSLARIQQLMTNTVPYVPLSVENHNNLAQLLDELNNILQQHILQYVY